MLPFMLEGNNINYNIITTPPYSNDNLHSFRERLPECGILNYTRWGVRGSEGEKKPREQHS